MFSDDLANLSHSENSREAVNSRFGGYSGFVGKLQILDFRVISEIKHKMQFQDSQGILKNPFGKRQTQDLRRSLTKRQILYCQRADENWELKTFGEYGKNPQILDFSKFRILNVLNELANYNT